MNRAGCSRFIVLIVCHLNEFPRSVTTQVPACGMSHHSHFTSAARHGRQGRNSTGRFKFLLGALVVVAALVTLFFSDIEWREVPAALQRVNKPVALLIMATLPIVGFPISAVYLAAGAIFGPLMGGVVVAGVTLVHVFATHLLASTVLRGQIEKLRQKWHHRVPDVPEGELGTLVAMIVIVPGLPYLARNCLLAFSKVPLRYLIGVAVPLYVARSYVTIFIGDLGNEASLRAMLILGGIFALKLGISALLFHRLKQRTRPAR
jgi:uncharacterized membrane protein YdjX (TVP38/TMEM64 family)